MGAIIGCLERFFTIDGDNHPSCHVMLWKLVESVLALYTSQEYTDLTSVSKQKGVPLAVSVIDMDWHKTAIPARFGSGRTGYELEPGLDS